MGGVLDSGPVSSRHRFKEVRDIMGALIKQMGKFGVVGVIAFLVDYLLMIALKELAGMDAVVAAGISFVVSLVVNYLLSMSFVFERRDDLSRRREFVLFVALSCVGLAINEACMWLGTELVGVDYRLVKIAATAVVMVWNFWSRKHWLEGDAKAAA